MNHDRGKSRGFTLVEVLVALVVVAIGLAALMIAVSGAARTSGYLRDKTLAQWIAMNRITEVRLNSSNKFAQNTDAAEVDFAGRTWHYDTKYFDTSISTMKRVIVRVYAGDAKTKGNPLAESTGFLGTALADRGSSNAMWLAGSIPPTGTTLTGATSNGTNVAGTTSTGAGANPSTTNGVPVTGGVPATNTSVPTPTPQPTP